MVAYRERGGSEPVIRESNAMGRDAPCFQWRRDEAVERVEHGGRRQDITCSFCLTFCLSITQAEEHSL